MQKYALLFMGLHLCAGQARAAPEPVDFDREIRPILTDRCYPCHGPDADSRVTDLRLDTPDGALTDRDGRAAFRPGDPDRSEAIRRIFSPDPDERMPPPDSTLTLTDRDRERLRQWVLDGAPWSTHWAFTSPARPPLPPVQDAPWPRNPIDRFVLARLEREQLHPSREAPRETLIRRVTLDLTGLPPTTDEVDAFLVDGAPDAYEKVVDRLLASPRYGERMAWEWLEASRYADTDGFQGDPTRTMWPWRDWLIQALNTNLPYDQFTREVLAGDLLPNHTQSQVIATGFHRNHMYNGEGGRIAEETRVENVFDRTETTATVWLGLTMTCARCHDHKFDPISQREYYQLYAFFNNTSESGRGGNGKAPPVWEYLSPEQRQARERYDQRLAEIARQMEGPMPEVDAMQRQWEQQIALQRTTQPLIGSTRCNDWSVWGPQPAPADHPEAAFDYVYPPEQATLGRDEHGNAEDGLQASDNWRTAPDYVDGQVHALPDTVGATYLRRTLEAPTARVLDVSLGSDDGIRVWLNGAEVHANNVRRSAQPDQDKVPLNLGAGPNELLIKIVNTGGPAGFYFRAARESRDGLAPELAAIVLAAPEQRTDEQHATLRQYYRQRHSSAWQRLSEERTRIEQQRAGLAAVQVMVMDELPADKRRTTSILTRGGYDKPQEPVTEGTPAFLPPLPHDAPRNRLTLATWLIDPQQPLTARVTVNRMWQMFFGSGIVETSEDFGRQANRPMHPQLLDWLALDFVRSGWDVKAIHRLIVTSATYRQSSKVISADNSWMSRIPRYRLPSWMLRDQALALSGLLVPTIGGPPVKPYQPPGVWADATFGKIRYEQDRGAALYRASIYIFWRRIVGPTMLFDGGKRQTCIVRTSQTNTPLHALTTLNDTTFVEAARVMAERLMRSNQGGPAERISQAFRQATARYPDDVELAVLVRRWNMLQAEFASHPAQAIELLSNGDAGRDETLDPAEHAAYAVICSLILNLDEVLSRE